MCHCEERSDEAIPMPVYANHGSAGMFAGMQGY